MDKSEKGGDNRDKDDAKEAKAGRRPRRERNTNETVENNNTLAANKEPFNANESSTAESKVRRRREHAGEVDDIANKQKSNADGWMVFTPAEAKKAEETNEERAVNL
jgi:hypothetical protein